MQSGFASLLQKHSLWLSVLLHVLLIIFLSFNYLFHFKTSENPSPEIYVPAFIYSQPSQAKAVNSQNSQEINAGRDKFLLSKEKINLPEDEEALTSKDATPTQRLTDYFTPQTQSLNSPKQSDPVHLIGDELRDDPLRQLLGAAITAHLNYPRVARELNLRGIASVEMLVHPDGTVSNIRLIKSSSQNVLDVAALNAVRAISPVHSVDLYLKEAKLLVVNIIFGGW